MNRRPSPVEAAALLVALVGNTSESGVTTPVKQVTRPRNRAHSRAGKVLGALGAVGLTVAAPSDAKADPDEFHAGLTNPNLSMEVRDPSGTLLGNFPTSMGANSSQGDSISLESEGVILVTVADYVNNTGDVFEVTDSGATPLGFNMVSPGDLSRDEASGLWGVVDSDTEILTLCEIANRTNCEGFDLSSLGTGAALVELNLGGPEPYAIVNRAVVSLGPTNIDSDPFPDGIPTLRASFGSGALYGMLMDRFDPATGGSITYVIDSNNVLSAIEVDGSSLTAMANATLTPVPTGNPLTSYPTSLARINGKLFVGGTEDGTNWIFDGQIDRFTMGNTAATTTWDARINNGVGLGEPIDIDFDSSGYGWMLYLDPGTGDNIAAQFDATGPFAFTGTTIPFSTITSGNTYTFSILRGTPSAPTDSDGDGDPVTTDCDDLDPNNYNGNTEICDGQDNNCDIAVDEGFDGDGDGVTSCATPDPDCNDTNATIYPGAPEFCGNGIDEDCDLVDPACPPGDADGDGYTSDVDCNDGDPAIYPGAPETTLNGIDDDCNPATLDDPDNDGDGSFLSADCDDADPNRFPGNPEVCGDSIDQDCDGSDEACPPDPNNIDDDGDGSTENQGDCDDADPNRFPGNPEVCGDTIDQDCDGSDETCPLDPDDIDDDGDGFTENQGDCNDTNPLVYPGAVEFVIDPSTMSGNQLAPDKDCDTNNAAVLGVAIDSDTDTSALTPDTINELIGLDESFNVTISNNSIHPLDGAYIITYEHTDPAQPSELVINRLEGIVRIDGPTSTSSTSTAAITGSEGTLLYEPPLNEGDTGLTTFSIEEGAHTGTMDTNAYNGFQADIEAYLVTHPNAPAAFIENVDGETVLRLNLAGGESVQYDSDSLLIDSSVPTILELLDYSNGLIEQQGDDDDDDSTTDDDDSGDDDDDTTPDDDDDVTPDDDDVADDDDATLDDDDTSDDDDSGETPLPGCGDGCNEGGDSGGSRLALLFAALGAGFGFGRRRRETGPLTGPAMIEELRSRVDQLALATASAPPQVTEISRDRIRAMGRTQTRGRVTRIARTHERNGVDMTAIKDARRVARA